MAGAGAIFHPMNQQISEQDSSSDAIYRMALAAMDMMPPDIRNLTKGVALRVADWPSRDMLDDLGMSDPENLTGMYQGIPLPHKSVAYPQTLPDTVWLFREPILLEWRQRGNVTLAELVQNVTIHEFAHHFGWSDDDIASIDQWWA